MRNRRQNSGRAHHRGAAPGILRHLRRSLRPHFRRELRALLAGVRHRGAYRRQDQQGHLPAGHRRHRHLSLHFLRLFGERRRAGQFLLPRLGPQAGDRRRAQQSMKEIWNSERMNALRLQHLEGRRRQNGVCGNCGQLSHCLPDNIDAHRLALLDKFKQLVRSIRTSSRRAAATANSRPWRRNEDPACHAASRRRRRQGACGVSAALPEGVEQTFFCSKTPRDRRYADAIEATARASSSPTSSSRWRACARGRHRPVRILEPSAPVRMPGALRVPADAQRILVAYFRASQAADPAGADRGGRPLRLYDRGFAGDPRGWLMLRRRRQRKSPSSIAASDFPGRRGGRRERQDAGIAYLGTVDFVKMHRVFSTPSTGWSATTIASLGVGCPRSDPVVARARAMRHPERIVFAARRPTRRPRWRRPISFSIRCSPIITAPPKTRSSKPCRWAVAGRAGQSR